MADVDQFVGGHGALRDLVAVNPGAQVKALGHWDARGDKAGPSTQLMELDITLDAPESGGDLAMVFSKLRATGGGFETLLFRLEVLGETFGEEVLFDELADAVDFFSSAFFLDTTTSPRRLSTEIVPPFSSTICRQTQRPNPILRDG